MGMRIYTVPFENVAIGTAVQDVFSFLTGAGNGLALHHIHLEANVSAEAALRLRLKRGTGTITQGSGGTVVTPAPIDPGDPALAGITCHIDDTTQATATTFTTLAGFYWDVALPFDHLPAPEDREHIGVSSILVLDLPAVIALTTISGFVKFHQLP